MGVEIKKKCENEKCLFAELHFDSLSASDCFLQNVFFFFFSIDPSNHSHVFPLSLGMQ